MIWVMRARVAVTINAPVISLTLYFESQKHQISSLLFNRGNGDQHIPASVVRIQYQRPQQQKERYMAKCSGTGAAEYRIIVKLQVCMADRRRSSFPPLEIHLNACWLRRCCLLPNPGKWRSSFRLWISRHWIWKRSRLMSARSAHTAL